MSELLIELFSEEIPARMQEAATKGLATLLTDELKKNSIAFETTEILYSPRRLSVCITGLPEEQKSYTEEVKGPPVTAAQQALDGFLRKNNIASISDCVVKKIGDIEYYFSQKNIAGGKTIETIGTLITTAIEKMNWPKSMRWGNTSFRWARPLHNILAIFDGQPVKGAISLGNDTSLNFNNQTFGHRFHFGDQPITVTSFADYKVQLERAHIVADPKIRRAKIWDDVQKCAEKNGFTVKPDEKLLTEVTGLVEYPVPFMGEFPQEFLEIPAEVISTSMREHQRYFSVLEKDGKLVNRFICVANIQPTDGGKTIIYGNEKVLRARLSDAGFFWQQDKKTKLANFMPRLEQIRFHEKLGSMSEKATRLKTLAAEIAKQIGTNTDDAAHAAYLCKADLVSSMVREFPEIQGVMGGYYAKLSGENDAISKAISTHYSPAGPNDSCPTDPVSVAVSLADKIDTIVGFFSIGEKPTGNKDPFALRRSALGIIRLILENKLDISLTTLLELAANLYKTKTPEGLIDFITDRFRNTMVDAGLPQKIVEAAIAHEKSDNLLTANNKIHTLADALASDDGASALAIIKRVTNILDSLKPNDVKSIPSSVDKSKLSTDEEKAVVAALEKAQLATNDKTPPDAAIKNLATLSDSVNSFFNNVMIVDKDETQKQNKLAIVKSIENLFMAIIDFRQIIR